MQVVQKDAIPYDKQTGNLQTGVQFKLTNPSDVQPSVSPRLIGQISSPRPPGKYRDMICGRNCSRQQRPGLPLQGRRVKTSFLVVVSAASYTVTTNWMTAVVMLVTLAVL